MISVTQILETFPEKELVEWKLRVGPVKAKQVSEEAKHIGSATDLKVQADCKGLPQDTFETLSSVEKVAVESCWQGWQKFKADHPDFLPSLTGIQQELVQGEYIGHPDFLLKREGWFGVVDLKCASQIRPSHWTQVAAYSWLKDSEHNALSLAILRLDKTTGGYEYVELTDPDQINYEVQVWLNYKVLYEHRQRVAERSRTMREDAVLYEP